jgi:hypothetical protein
MDLPPEFELVGFFEVEPTLRIPGAPWAYNGLTFESLRGVHLVRCRLEMDVGSVSVQWLEGDVSRADIALKWVRSVSLVRSGGVEALVASGISGNPDVAMELRLRPEISLKLVAQPKHPSSAA